MLQSTSVPKTLVNVNNNAGTDRLIKRERKIYFFYDFFYNKLEIIYLSWVLPNKPSCFTSTCLLFIFPE
ncbi:MAG: hypothetical protein ACI83B_001678 [Sediminicola sp.]|jgi:hypothetical protein